MIYQTIESQKYPTSILLYMLYYYRIVPIIINLLLIKKYAINANLQYILLYFYEIYLPAGPFLDVPRIQYPTRR